MNYREQLSPWVIVQLLPDCQRRTIARYRRRSEAEAYVQILKRVMPRSTLAIVFDPGDGDLQKEEAIEFVVKPLTPPAGSSLGIHEQSLQSRLLILSLLCRLRSYSRTLQGVGNSNATDQTIPARQQQRHRSKDQTIPALPRNRQKLIASNEEDYRATT